MDNLKNSSHRIVVIGAGISGLACAHRINRLAEKSDFKIELSVLEASPRAGGKIITDRSGGILTEGGPDSFLTLKPEALDLAKELGLEKDLIPANKNLSRVWIHYGKKLYPLPKGTGLIPSKIIPFLFSNFLSFKGRLRVLAEPWVTPKLGMEDESLASFISRRMGPEFLHKIADPILSGIYAAPSHQISLLSTFPSFRDMENHGGLFKSISKSKPNSVVFMTLKDGLSSLSNALIQNLPPKALKRDSPVLSIQRENKGWEIKTSKETFFADSVVLAVPANSASLLCDDFSPEISAALSEISFTTSVVLNLVYPRKSVSHSLKGYGFVSVKDDSSSIMAATFSSSKFPHRSSPEKALIRVFLGENFSSEGELVSKDEASLARMVHQELSPILGLKSNPEEFRVYKWIKAHPVYSVGHGLRMKRIESCLKDLPGIFLAGSSYYGIGLPDCIRSGQKAAEASILFLKNRRNRNYHALTEA